MKIKYKNQPKRIIKNKWNINSYHIRSYLETKKYSINVWNLICLNKVRNMFIISIMYFCLIQNSKIYLKKLNRLFNLLLTGKILAFLLMDRQDQAKLLQWRDLTLICYLTDKIINRLNFLEFYQELQYTYNRK